MLKRFSVKKGTLPLRLVTSPGSFDCRLNALSSELRRFHNFSHRILLTPIRLRMYHELFKQCFKSFLTFIFPALYTTSKSYSASFSFQRDNMPPIAYPEASVVRTKG